MQALSHELVCALLFILILSMVLISNSRDVYLQRIFSNLDDESLQPEDYENVGMLCATCKDRFGLTDKEVEVAQMLCRGRSKAYIAEALYVTENTVRTHTRHIYAKLGVHSRSELQSLILDGAPTGRGHGERS